MGKSPTPIYSIAQEFSENTSLSIFLTGKAGTGKTTFLKQLKETTNKQIAVVAPTGVAAINATGVTIHSFFQLPLAPFVPTVAARKELIQKMKVTKTRQNVMRQLEILVIDEISMVRADLLDAIDTVLRHFRFRHDEPFGGVQVIYIGDLYQLPPVVPPHEQDILAQYYASPFFFSSYVIQQQPPIYIELDKIFRQSNTEFVELLNEVRNNHLTKKGFQLLKSRFNPHFKLSENPDYIFLTTHNATADKINKAELQKITEPLFSYHATVKGEFHEKNYPNDMVLKLKVGAKVMFIANDIQPQRRYYNGRIGVVTRLDSTHIYVRCEDANEDILVSTETWRNIRYDIDSTNGLIIERELGTFSQYPLRLAWAITIHKSQGLTFDKTAIDAALSFSSGQVYVALSRCRSLDGIVLTSPVQPQSLIVDSSVIQYSQSKPPLEQLTNLLDSAKKKYHITLLKKTFDFKFACGQMTALLSFVKKHSAVFNQEGSAHAWALQRDIFNLQDVSTRFQQQLDQIYSDSSLLHTRLIAATNYFLTHIADLVQRCSNSPAAIFDLDTAKEYKDSLKTLFIELSFKKHLIAGIGKNHTSIEEYYRLKDTFTIPSFKFKANSIFDNEEELDEKLGEEEDFIDYLDNLDIVQKLKLFFQKKGKKKEEKSKKNKTDKVASYLISIEMYKNGKKIAEIAKERQLAESTIGTHLTRGVASNMLPLSDFVDDEIVAKIRKMAAAGCSNSEIFSTFEGNVDYMQIRMALCETNIEK